MARTAQPSPCCGRRGDFVRYEDGGRWHRRCSKCGTPYTWTSLACAQADRAEAAHEVVSRELAPRIRSIAALPAGYRSDVIRAIDRLTETYTAALARVGGTVIQITRADG